jgi:RimJ/RimL family protein N-acetyltransferase
MSFKLLQLGLNPGLEAEISKRLYMSEGVDEAVVSEFDTTVTAYRELNPESIAKRIEGKYGGLHPQAVGFIALFDEDPVAMVFAGPKEYLSPDGIVDGVNVSAWVVSQARGLGIGRKLINIGVTAAFRPWNDKTIWTSIHTGNIASQKMCQAVGFVKAHPQLEDEKVGRDIYVLPSHLAPSI